MATRKPRQAAFRLASLSTLFATALITACSNPSLRSITVTPTAGATILTSQGQTAQFQALATYQQGSHPATTQNVTSSVTWSSNSESVADVDSTGLVTADGSGVAIITASLNGPYGLVQGTSNVQVNLTSTPPTGLTSITVVPSTQPITVLGQTANFVAIGNYTGQIPASQNLTNSVTWASSAPGVATINSSGVATAVSAGTATITATGNTSATGAVVGTATITVSSSNANGLTAITIIPNSQVVYTTGETSQYIAIGTFAGTSPVTQDITTSANLKWISSDISVATISAAGLATETGFGTTAITAEWVQSGAPAITGTATFTSQANGPANYPSLEVYKVGNGATTTTSVITTSPASTQPAFSCGTGTGCSGYYFTLGTTVTLTVSPVPSDFGGFTSNCTPVAGNPVTSCTVMLNGNQAVGAIFN
jgi:hypothetical protein